MTVNRFASDTTLVRAVLLSTALLAICRPVLSQDHVAAGSETFLEKAGEVPLCRVERGALVRATVAQQVNWSRLPRGAVLEAQLSLPLYAGEQVALPAGAPLRLTVGSSERMKENPGFWRKVGRVIVRAFNPLEKSQAPQYRVTLNDSELPLRGGEWVSFKAGAVRAGSAFIVAPSRKPDATGTGDSPALESSNRGTTKAEQVVVLQIEEEVPLSPSLCAMRQESEMETARRGTRAYLLTALSASGSHEGDKFQAQLAEPVHLADRVFGPGSVVEGIILRRTPPRRLSRAGMLQLRVDRIIARSGEALAVPGTLSRAEADSQSRFVLAEEGTLRGRRRGAHALVDLGISLAVGKITDDLAESPIRALGASMGDAAVANAARFVGLAGAITFLVTRRGQDVRIPKYAEIEFDFGRVNAAPAASSANR